jgi:DNA-binding NtrC family response regulator
MEGRGIRVLWAQTIRQAAALLNPVVNRTVVVTELALKDGNWRDLLETVRYSSIPVLLVSSTSTAELWWDALDCGVEDILEAPLSTSRLAEYLEKQVTTKKK